MKEFYYSVRYYACFIFKIVRCAVAYVWHDAFGHTSSANRWAIEMRKVVVRYTGMLYEDERWK